MASYAFTPSGDVVLILSPAEARGLFACAGEGAEGLFNDAGSARDYIGGAAAVAAARRAVDAVGQAAATAKKKSRAKR